MIFPSLIQFSDLGLLILRIAIGLIFLYHALPKLKNPKGMAVMMGMPKMAMILVILGIVEVLSSLGIILGVYTQLAALLLAIVMLGAIFVKKMKWHISFAAMDKTGWEFDLILLAANVAILLTGGGSISL